MNEDRIKLDVICRLMDGIVAHKTKMSKIQNVKSEIIKRLDDEIIKADALVVSLNQDLARNDADKKNAMREFDDSLKSLDRELTDNIRSLDRELADDIKSFDGELNDRLKSIEEQVTAALSSLSFDSALRNQVIDLREKLAQSEIQQVDCQAKNQQIESQIQQKRESIRNLEDGIQGIEREIRDIDHDSERSQNKWKQSWNSFWWDLKHNDYIGCFGCLGVILVIATSGLILILPAVIFIVYFIAVGIISGITTVVNQTKKAERRGAITGLQKKTEIIQHEIVTCVQQRQSITKRQQELSEWENRIEHEIKRLMDIYLKRQGIVHFQMTGN